MLILTRKPGESLAILPHPGLNPGTPLSRLFQDGPIRIEITQVSGHAVRVGIAAHPALGVWREEVLVTGRPARPAAHMVARRLASLRQQQGLTHAALAQAAGLSLTAVAAAETGVAVLGLDELEALAGVLGVGVGALFRPG